MNTEIALSNEDHNSFSPLHVHSCYSLLDGLSKITEIVSRAKNIGLKSIALTDHGVMYGIIDFYHACKAAGIKPILGCEVYVAPGSRFDKKSAKGDDKYSHLILLAENNTGYDNLTKIVSHGFTEGYYYKPRVDKDLLRQYHEGIIASSACLAGEIHKYILSGNMSEAEKTALEYQDIFGKGNFFLELQDHGLAEDQKNIEGVLELHKRTGIDMIATNDSHYTVREDYKAHEILLCMQTGKELSSPDRMRYLNEGEYYIKSEEEMRALFPYSKEAIDNTGIIADRCNVELEFHNTKVPKFDVPEGFTTWTYLQNLCYTGLKKRYPEDDGTIKKKLDYELSIIHKMGYVEYFLIVWDYINWARENDIPVGPGRGSAAGAIVSYVTGITDIDPIRYGLVFERFLNPERVSMPDIDEDFDYEFRQRVIDHVKQKYGIDNVTQIITFGTMAAKSIIKNVGKVLEIPYAEANRISKMIPNDLHMTITLALEKSAEFKTEYDSNPATKDLVDLSIKLEGLPKSCGTHAAGVVICSAAAEEFIPLALNSDKTGVVTQYNMTTVEELGLLKMDFLGLRTLTVIRYTIDMIQKTSGISIDIDQIDYDDKKVLNYIGSGNTAGVFQLESAGMMAFMKQLKPASIEDVIAGISLYRPGPMDFIPSFIEGKNHPESITYACPQLEPILKSTYGCIVYQEQVMQIVRDLAGYTMGQSDNVRRAMSKKKQAVIDAGRKDFVYGNEEQHIAGCIANGISEEVANSIYDSMVAFAKYAFNKSHAACYAVISYQTAWLKYYYPVEYMSGLMSTFLDNQDKKKEYVQAAKAEKIPLLLPDIRMSSIKFSVVDGKILTPLNAVKSVGVSVAENIIKLRDQYPCDTFENVMELLSAAGADKTAIENLIKCGCCDYLGGNRRQYATIYPKIYESIHNEGKNNVAGQLSLFDLNGPVKKEDIVLPDIPEYSNDIYFGNEFELMGTYVSGHPLDKYASKLEKLCTHSAVDFLDAAPDDNDEIDNDGIEDEYTSLSVQDTRTVNDGQKVIIGGIIRKVKKITSKKGDPMAFVSIEDLKGIIEVVVFPTVYREKNDLLVEGTIVIIKGNASVKDKVAVLAETIDLLEITGDAPELWIRFPNKAECMTHQPLIRDEINSMKNGKGHGKVILFSMQTKQFSCMTEHANTDELYPKMVAKYGDNNVVLKQLVDKKHI